jgi:hypothetical protein
VADQLVQLQRNVLNALMSDTLAERLLDNIDKTRDREAKPLTVRDLHRTLREAIWSPASKAPRKNASDDAAPWQRNLQREHVNRLSMQVLRGALLCRCARTASAPSAAAGGATPKAHRQRHRQHRRSASP